MSNTVNLCQADAIRLPFPDRSFDLVIGSPPYCDARTYGIGAQRDARQWVEWMLTTTEEALRVSRGAVIWVAAGVTRDRTYWPACEGLMWEWFKRGGSAYRPCYWHRYGIPGTGGDQWFRHTIEHVMCFKRSGPLPYADPRANGHIPEFDAGGPMTYRDCDGKRADRGKRWGLNVTRRRGSQDKRDPCHTPAHDRYEAEGYPVATPSNIISTGADTHYHPLAHESEAPYHEAVPRFFIRSHSPPDGIILDPFGGSGTSGAAAVLEGRRYVLCDIRAGVGALDTARRRLANSDRYGIKSNPSLEGPRPVTPMTNQMSLLD